MFSVLGGHIADRYSKRTILIWMQTVQMLLAFALGILASGIWIKLQAWHIVLLSGLLGLSSAFNMPAQQAFVVELVENRDALANAIALSSLRFNLARVVGPLMALVLISSASFFGCAVATGSWSIATQALRRLAIDAGFVVAASALVFWFKQRTVHRRRPLD